MKDQTKHNDSRRKFLAKTSAVSLISALPATSVWGACTVSGALSGGSKVNNDCTTISLIGGRSHGFWKDTSTGKALGSAFPYLKTYTKGSDRKKCEKTHLISLIDLVKNETVFLGNDENGQAVSIHINTALTSNASPAKHLAAVYLNAVFGFYSLSLPVMLSSGHTISHGAELIAHLYALDIINPGMDSNDYFGFTDGKTAYTATASGCS